MWLIPENQLTVDQLEAVRLSSIQHRVIVGGPGSGKTLVLLHRAKKFLNDGLPESQIRVIVYTKVLRRYLQSAIEVLGFRDETVTNIDKLIVEIYKRKVSKSLPKGEDNQIDWNQIRNQALAIYKSESIPPIYDAIFVDEGQDLTRDAIELLTLATEHLTIAMDSRQDVFGTGMGISEVCKILQVPRESAQLLSAYRCTQFIVNLASAFLPEKQQSEFRRSNLISMDGIQKPVVTYFSNAEQEFDALFQQLVTVSSQGSSAVLLPSTQLQLKYAKAMRDRGIEVAVLAGNQEVQHDFMGNTPMFMTYHSAKGLTVDSVFLPSLSEDAFSTEHMSTEAARNRLLFVGITRAVKWLWLGIPRENALREIRILTEVTDIPLSTNFVIYEADVNRMESKSLSKAQEQIKDRPNKINIEDLL